MQSLGCTLRRHPTSRATKLQSNQIVTESTKLMQPEGGMQLSLVPSAGPLAGSRLPGGLEVMCGAHAVLCGTSMMDSCVPNSRMHRIASPKNHS